MQLTETTITHTVPAVCMDGVAIEKSVLLELCSMEPWTQDQLFAYVIKSAVASELFLREGLMLRDGRGHCWGTDKLKQLLIDFYGEAIQQEWDWWI